MRILSDISSSPRARMWLTIIALQLLAFAVGASVANSNFDIKELYIVLIAIVLGVLFFAPSERFLEGCFWIWIVTLAAGYRAIDALPGLNIHISEGIAWGLFVSLLMKALARGHRLEWNIPTPLLLFIAWAALIGISFWAVGAGVNYGLFEFKQFLLAVPTFALVFHFVNRDNWRKCLVPLLGAGVVLIIVGYLFPDEHSFVQSEYGSYVRLLAPGWSVVIAFFLAPLIGGALAEFSLGKEILIRSVTGITLGIVLVGVYLAGYRGIWIGSVLGLAAYAASRNLRALPVGGLAALVVAVYPDIYQTRLAPVFLNRDSSVIIRQMRFQDAWNQFLASPLIGNGLGYSGAVHSDLTQILADVGLIGAGLLVAWYFGLTRQVIRVIFDRTLPTWIREHAAGGITTMVIFSVILTVESVFTAVYVTPIFWFIVALYTRLVSLAKESPTVSRSP